MNGPEEKIEIFKPFGEAFELTKKILFQPFDIGKWFVIGFAAFLAGLSGGMNFNFNPRGLKDMDWRTTSFSQSVGQNPITDGSAWPLWVIPLIVVLVILILALVAVLLWLGARGRFIFIDCIVRNRGAIVEPWREYRTEGNSFFFFSLLVGLIALVIVLLATLPMVIPAIMHGRNAAFGIGMTFGVIFLVAVIMLLAVAWTLSSQLMVPVMYRQRCRAMAAFRQVLGQITAHPSPFILYFLFYFVLIVAVAIIGCVSICLTCCITAIPYIGTVILLPIHVLLQSFTLLFVRQLGPDYDAWGNITPPEPPPGPEALPA
jgi:hypothetical protein